MNVIDDNVDTARITLSKQTTFTPLIIIKSLFSCISLSNAGYGHESIVLNCPDPLREPREKPLKLL